jgi:very-short-patch-repair endonuclease
VAREIHIDAAIRTLCGSRGVEAAIAMLAGRQYGVVARVQLLALGLTASAIQRRIRAGRLHPLFLGVYAVGHRSLSREGRWMAGVLAGGEGAVVVDASAAALHGFAADDKRQVHVGAHRRSRDGVRFHRRKLAPDEITTKQGIPVTTPARTLLDLAATTNTQRLERALREALFRGATNLPALRRLLSRRSGHRGARALRIAIERVQDAPGRIRSDGEHRFLNWLRRRGLPLPESNVQMQIGDLLLEPDFVWRAARVIVEIDDRSTHARRQDFESDRRRDRAVQAAGWRPIRITEPYDAGLAADLTRLLAVVVRPAARIRRTKPRAAAGT